MRAWRGNACNWHQKRRNPGSFFLTSFRNLDRLSASVDGWEGEGTDVGLSELGLPMGAFAKIVCASLGV